MDSRKEILRRVDAAARDSGRWVAAFDALSQRDGKTAYPLIRNYVRKKFLLDDEDGEASELLGLADLSLRKILRLRREGKLIGDISQGCGGASSVITKKVLLMKAMQEDFHVTFSPAQAAAIQTLEELTAAIVDQREGTDGQHF